MTHDERIFFRAYMDDFLCVLRLSAASEGLYTLYERLLPKNISLPQEVSDALFACVNLNAFSLFTVHLKEFCDEHKDTEMLRALLPDCEQLQGCLERFRPNGDQILETQTVSQSIQKKLSAFIIAYCQPGFFSGKED